MVILSHDVKTERFYLITSEAHPSKVLTPTFLIPSKEDPIPDPCVNEHLKAPFVPEMEPELRGEVRGGKSRGRT